MSMLLPAAAPLALALAALVCFAPALRARLRWDFALPALVVLAGLSSVAQLAWLWSGQPESLRLTLSPWTVGLFGAGPSLDVDLLAALAVLLVCLVTALGLLQGMRDGAQPEAFVGPLAIAAASVLFCEATRSPLGLVAAWLLLDVALFFGGGIRRRGLLASQLGLLFVLAGLMGPVDATWIGGDLPADLRFWLIAAAGIRMGSYPFSWAVPSSRAKPAWAALLFRVAPTVAGVSLAMRAGGATLATDIEPVVLIPGLVALFFGALMAWLAANRAAALDWSTSFSAGLVMLAAALGDRGSLAAVLLLVDLVLGRSIQFLGQTRASDPGRAVFGLATASLAGIPPTLGFIGRLLLYTRLLQVELPELLILVAVASALAAVPFSAKPRPASVGPVLRPLLPLLAALALAEALLGLLPGWLPPGLGLASWPSRPGAWQGAGPLVLGAILLPPVLGFIVHRAGWGLRRPPADAARRRYGRVLRLTDLFDGLRTALIHSGRVLHQSLGLVEGHRTMALTLLAGVGVGLTLMAGGDAPSAPAPPSLVGLAFWAMAAGIAGVNLLASRRLVSLIVLAASYLLAGVVLLLSSASPAPSTLVISAMFKPLAGIVVVAILAISVVQLAGDGSPERPSPLLEAESGDDSGRLLHVIALLIAVLLVGSMHSTSLPESLGDTLLRPALTLVAGGVLTAIFARSPLRLAVSVLLALIGFEMIYAQLDPGLFMTGGLAVFHILFAILASLFVGRSLDGDGRSEA